MVIVQNNSQAQTGTLWANVVWAIRFATGETQGSAAPMIDTMDRPRLIAPIATDAADAARVRVGLPKDRSLIGKQLYNQFAVLDTGANAFGFAFSNAATATMDLC